MNIEGTEKIEEVSNIEIDDNVNIIDLWAPYEFNISPNYKYIIENPAFLFFSNILYYIIAYPILKIITKIIYDLKIEGKENLKKVKSGAISVSNHVLYLDCAMVGLALGSKKVYYTTQEESFKIPFVRKLIKGLRAIPIPKSIENRKYFLKSVETALKKNRIIHIYPEAALWPYCERIRKFKNGAFDISVKNDVPIIPIAIKFRTPEGIRKIIKNKKDVTIKILEPIYPNKKEGNIKKRIEELKEQTYKNMKNAV